MWQVVGTLIGSIFIWLLVVFVSQDIIGLKAKGVGILNTAYAIFLAFSLLIMGIGKATSQRVSENISDKRVAFEHARNGTIVAILVGIIVGVGLIITSFFIGTPLTFQSELSSIFFVIGIVMIFTGFRDGLSSNLAAVGEYDDMAKAFAINPLFQFLAGIILIILIRNPSLSLPVSLIIIVYVFGIIAQTMFLTKHFRRLWFNTQIFRLTKVDRRAFKIFRQGVYFAITDIIPVGILGFITVIILLAFTGNYATVGSYSIILGYSLGALTVAGFAWPLITSVAEAYGQRDSNRIRFYLHLIAKIYFYVTFLVLAFTLGLSHGIIWTFHGSIYLQGSLDVWIPFLLVISGFAVAALEYILSSILLGIGKGRTAAVYLGSIFLITVGFTTLFLWLNLFSSPQLNAAFGFLLGPLILLPLLPFLIKKYVGESIPWSIGFKSLLALACTLGVAAVLLWPIWPTGALIPVTNIFVLVLMMVPIVLLFVILLVFFGSIPPEDLELMERKAKEYGLESIAGPLLSFFRKIMNVSPFCKLPEGK